MKIRGSVLFLEKINFKNFWSQIVDGQNIKSSGKSRQNTEIETWRDGQNAVQKRFCEKSVP